jgi:hypothetical protein
MYLRQDAFIFQDFGNEAGQETILSGLLLGGGTDTEAG